MRCPICLPISSATEEIVVRNGPGSIHPVSISAYPALRIAVQMERMPAVCLRGGGLHPGRLIALQGHIETNDRSHLHCAPRCAL